MKKQIFNKKMIVRIFYTCLMLLSIILVTVFSINHYVKKTTANQIVSADSILSDKQYDCILVLGCGLRSDGTPSHMLSDRLRRAVELYKSGAAPKIIMSGDHGGTDYDEVNAMRDYALSQGVDQKDIFMDHAGFSTYESMYRAKEIFCVTDMIIVTHEYHLYRALYISGKLGIESIGVDSDYRKYYGQNLRDLREVAARCKDYIKCILKPEPTYLGETIPVNGDGTITCD